MTYRRRYSVILVLGSKRGVPILALEEKAPGVSVGKPASGEEMIRFTIKIPKKDLPGEVLVVTCRGYTGTDGAGYLGSYRPEADIKAGAGPVTIGVVFPATWLPEDGKENTLEVYVVYDGKRPK